jgi:hypothetical protein
MIPLLVGVLGIVVVVVVMGLSTWGVRRLFRFRRPLRVTAARREELQELAKRIDRQTLGAVLLLMFACPAAVTIVVDQLAGLWVARHPGTVYVFDMVTPRATWLKFVLPTGVVWGGCVAWWLCAVLMRRVYGGRTTAKYLVAMKLQWGLDYPRAGRACFAALALLCVPVAVLEADWYARVEEDAFVVNDFWGLGERRYPFAQVDQIVRVSHLHTKKGDVVERDQYHILFTDGREWYMEIAFEEYEPAIRYVSRKAGKPVRRAQFIEDVRGR